MKQYSMPSCRKHLGKTNDQSKQRERVRAWRVMRRTFHRSPAASPMHGFAPGALSLSLKTKSTVAPQPLAASNRFHRHLAAAVAAHTHRGTRHSKNSSHLVAVLRGSKGARKKNAARNCKYYCCCCSPSGDPIFSFASHDELALFVLKTVLLVLLQGEREGCFNSRIIQLFVTHFLLLYFHCFFVLLSPQPHPSKRWNKQEETFSSIDIVPLDLLLFYRTLSGCRIL